MSDQYEFFAPPRSGAPPAGEAVVQPSAPGQVAQPTAPGQFAPPVAPGQFAPPVSGYGTPQRFAGQQQWMTPAGRHGAYGMQTSNLERSPRPGTIVAAAVLTFVQAALTIVVGFSLLVLIASFNNSGTPFGLPGLGDVTAIVGLVGVVMLVLGGFLVFCGLRILAGALWAAIVVAGLQAFGLLAALANLVEGDLVGVIVNGGFPTAVLICLFTARSRAWLSLR